MASLYIKDSEAAALASEIAAALGKTKTEIVRDLLRKKKAEIANASPKRDFVQWLDDYHRADPMPPPTGLKADKAFFDKMWGEPE